MSDHGGGCTRRSFLLGAATTTVTVLIAPLPWQREASAAPARRARYPRKQIGRLGELDLDVPIEFEYPDSTRAHSRCFLVKLGTEAGGGVGPDRDIVAFSSICTHMGGSLAGTFKGAHKVIGPCTVHLTTFDLTRYGIVVAGHATESLPQILLEIDGDRIFATGVQGLLFGRSHNLGDGR